MSPITNLFTVFWTHTPAVYSHVNSKNNPVRILFRLITSPKRTSYSVSAVLSRLRSICMLQEGGGKAYFLNGHNFYKYSWQSSYRPQPNILIRKVRYQKCNPIVQGLKYTGVQLSETTNQNLILTTKSQNMHLGWLEFSCPLPKDMNSYRNNQKL